MGRVAAGLRNAFSVGKYRTNSITVAIAGTIRNRHPSPSSPHHHRQAAQPENAPRPQTPKLSGGAQKRTLGPGWGWGLRGVGYAPSVFRSLRLRPAAVAGPDAAGRSQCLKVPSLSAGIIVTHGIRKDKAKKG